MLLAGKVHLFNFGKHSRRYANLTLPFREILELTEVRPFSALTRKGEQRHQDPAHMRNLVNSIREGLHTPTAMAASVPPELQGEVRYESAPDGDLTFSLETGAARLSQTDGGHRRCGLELLLADLQKAVKKEMGRPAPDQEVLALAEVLTEDAYALPFPLTVYLDTNPQSDFLNLQKGKPVDRSVEFTMKSFADEFDDPAYRRAVELGAALHRAERNPFFGQLRLDTAMRTHLPVATLCARGSSDLSTSLIGLARVGERLGLPNSALVGAVGKIYQQISSRYAELLEPGRPLTPFASSGTRAASTMWVGLAILLCWHARKAGRLADSARELCEVCHEALCDARVAGSFSAADKRVYMGDLARRLFAGTEGVPFHYGVPLELVTLLSATAFNAPRLKREPRGEKCQDAGAEAAAE